MARTNRTPALVAAALLAACSQDPTAIREVRGRTMGSFYVVKWVGDVGEGAVGEVVEQVLADYDRCFSLWREDSEIARWNHHPAGEPFAATDLFRAVLATALDLARCTDGAYDPTVAPLTALYRRGKEAGTPPTPEELEQARARVGHRHVRITADGVVKEAADVELDLDGIVAGACADDLVARLEAIGIANVMIDVTGEVLCRGEKPGGVPWQIGIEVPGDPDAVTRLPLRDRALCTSGSYRNRYAADGEVRHHILDPRTGENAPNGVLSVSVLAASCAVADGLATALMVLGPDRAEEVLDACGGAGAGARFVLGAADGAQTEHLVRWPRTD